jgi:hypothetical protein
MTPLKVNCGQLVTERCVDFGQSGRAWTELFCIQGIERTSGRVHRRVQVGRQRVDVQQARDDLAARLVRLHEGHGGVAVGRVVVGVQAAQAQQLPSCWRTSTTSPGAISAVISSRSRDEVDAAHRLVVLAHVVVALGAARMVVEGDAGADDVDEGGAAVLPSRP